MGFTDMGYYKYIYITNILSPIVIKHPYNFHIQKVMIPGLGMTCGQQPASALSLMQTKKKEAYAGDEAAWADIARAKFSLAHPEFILIDIAESILN